MNASERPLAERRVIETLTKEKIPGLETKLKDALGRKIPVTVDLATFPAGTEVFDWLESRGFESVLSGLPKVASDALGKQALEAKVTADHFVYDYKIETVDKALSFKDKTLVITFYWDGALMLGGDLVAEQLAKML